MLRLERIGIVTMVILGFCLSSSFVLGATKVKKKKKKKKTHWDYEQTYKFLGTAQQGEVAKEITNPNNQFYQLPVRNLLAEFRPELQGSYKQYKLVFRPRATLANETRDIPPLSPAPPGYVEAKAQENKSEVYMNETYIAGTPNGKLQYVLGLQNFQWGPAELASPSNPLFRDLGLSKTYFFETRGKGLVRANYSPSGQTTFIFISELFDNGVDRDASDPKFYKKGVIKAEFADESQTNYIGLVFSGSEGDKPRYGSYAHYELTTGLTAYYDLTGQSGSRIWKAQLTPLGPTFVRGDADTTAIHMAALAGFRYVTEGNIDYRLEGFYEDAAWDEKERNLGRAVLGFAPVRDNAMIYLNPGSFFPGEKFVYLSVRIPNWGWKDSFTLSLRDLHSLTDNTEKLQLAFDTFIGDNIVVSTGVTAAAGKHDGELTQGYSYQAFLTAAWTL